MSNMSTLTEGGGRVPKLTLGWRLLMSLGDMKRSEIAEQLGVDDSTISRWTHDKGQPPKRAYLAQWALLTGTDRRWLETGMVPDGPDLGPGDSPTAEYSKFFLALAS